MNNWTNALRADFAIAIRYVVIFGGIISFVWATAELRHPTGSDHATHQTLRISQ